MGFVFGLAGGLVAWLLVFVPVVVEWRRIGGRRSGSSLDPLSIGLTGALYALTGLLVGGLFPSCETNRESFVYGFLALPLLHAVARAARLTAI